MRDAINLIGNLVWGFQRWVFRMWAMMILFLIAIMGLFAYLEHSVLEDRKSDSGLGTIGSGASSDTFDPEPFYDERARIRDPYARPREDTLREQQLYAEDDWGR